MPAFAPLVNVHLATFLFGLAGVLGASVGLSATQVTFGRTLFAALGLMLVWVLISKPRQLKLSFYSVLSGVLLALHWLMFFTSIQMSTVAVGLLSFSTCPLFVALLEPYFFHESVKPYLVIASIAVLLGVAVMTGVLTAELIYADAVFVGIVGALLFALLQILNRKLTVDNGAIATSMVQNVVATSLLLPFAFVGLGKIEPVQWLQLLGLGVGCTAVAYTMFIHALKQIKASTASIIAAGLEPAYGIGLALLFLSQVPEAHVLVGGLIILLAVTYTSYFHTRDDPLKRPE